MIGWNNTMLDYQTNKKKKIRLTFYLLNIDLWLSDNDNCGCGGNGKKYKRNDT